MKIVKQTKKCSIKLNGYFAGTRPSSFFDLMLIRLSKLIVPNLYFMLIFSNFNRK